MFRAYEAGPANVASRTGAIRPPRIPPHFTSGTFVVPLKCEPTVSSSPMVRSVLSGNAAGLMVSHFVGMVIPKMLTELTPRAAFVGTLRFTHPTISLQFEAATEWIVPAVEPTWVNVTPTVVLIPSTEMVALNGGTTTVPVTEPSISPFSFAPMVALPLKVPPSGRTIAWLSAFGVSDPDTTKFSRGKTAADAAAATDITPTAANTAANTATRPVLRNI